MTKLIEYYYKEFLCDKDHKKSRGGFRIFFSSTLVVYICKKHARQVVQGLNREFNITPFIKKP